MTPEQIEKAREMVGLGIPVARVARNYEIGRTTLYRYLSV